jgi:hypothetical protein
MPYSLEKLSQEPRSFTDRMFGGVRLSPVSTPTPPVNGHKNASTYTRNVTKVVAELAVILSAVWLG